LAVGGSYCLYDEENRKKGEQRGKEQKISEEREEKGRTNIPAQQGGKKTKPLFLSQGLAQVARSWHRKKILARGRNGKDGGKQTRSAGKKNLQVPSKDGKKIKSEKLSKKGKKGNKENGGGKEMRTANNVGKRG